MVGDVAACLACDVRPALDLCVGSAVARLLPPARSPAQDAVAANSSLDDGVCVCDLSAPRGAEADARFHFFLVNMLFDLDQKLDYSASNNGA